MAFPHDGKKFKEGQSGNLKGRPKLPDLKAIMADVLGKETDGKTAAEVLIAKLYHIATSGKDSVNLKAADMLLSRGYGLPKDIKEVTLNSTPVILNWTDDQPDSEAEGSEEAAG